MGTRATGRLNRHGVLFRLGVLLCAIVVSGGMLCSAGCSSQSSEPVYLLESQTEYNADGSLFRSESFEYDDYGNVMKHKVVSPDPSWEGRYWMNAGFRNNLGLDDRNVAISWLFGSDNDSADDLAKAQSYDPDFNESYAVPKELNITYGGDGQVTDIASDYLTAHFSEGEIDSYESNTWRVNFAYEDTSEGKTVTVDNRPLSAISRYLDHEETIVFIPNDPSEMGGMTGTSYFTELGGSGGDDAETISYEISFDENGCPVYFKSETGERKEMTWARIKNPNPLAKMDNKRIVSFGITSSLLPVQ